MFAEMKSRWIAVLSYHKYPGEDWPVEEFISRAVTLAAGEQVAMRPAERGTPSTITLSAAVQSKYAGTSADKLAELAIDAQGNRRSRILCPRTRSELRVSRRSSECPR